jgi:hypothetical protein
VPPAGRASGITLPSTCVSVIARYAASVLGGYDYLRQTTFSSCIFLPLWWLPAVWPLCPAPWSQTGKGVDSSTAAVRFSSAATASGSSCTHRVVSQARLLNSMYYSGMDFTYKLDRTTVTVGAPSMLDISMSLSSAGASSSARAATGSPDPVVGHGSSLLSSVGTYSSATLVACCVMRDRSSSTVGAGLQLLSVGSPTVSQSSPSP